MSDKLPPSPGPDAYHRERSKCIDAFAALETAALKVMDALEIKSAGESFGQKNRQTWKSQTYPEVFTSSANKADDSDR